MESEFVMENDDEEKEELHDMIFKLLFVHAFVVGMLVSGGNHTLAQVFITWIHFLFFLAYVAGNYFV